MMTYASSVFILQFRVSYTRTFATICSTAVKMILAVAVSEEIEILNLVMFLFQMTDKSETSNFEGRLAFLHYKQKLHNPINMSRPNRWQNLFGYTDHTLTCCLNSSLNALLSHALSFSSPFYHQSFYMALNSLDK